jgi:cyclic pyranopterin phosphate synthase
VKEQEREKKKEKERERKRKRHRKWNLFDMNIVNSLDTLDPLKFPLITRREGFDHVMRSIRMALELGYNPLKINCVVMRGVNDNEILDFVKWTERDPVRLISFIWFFFF